MENNRRRSEAEKYAGLLEEMIKAYRINSSATAMPFTEIRSEEAFSADLRSSVVDTCTRSFETSSAKRNDSPSSPPNKPSVRERKKRRRSSLGNRIKLFLALRLGKTVLALIAAISLNLQMGVKANLSRQERTTLILRLSLYLQE